MKGQRVKKSKIGESFLADFGKKSRENTSKVGRMKNFCHTQLELAGVQLVASKRKLFESAEKPERPSGENRKKRSLQTL